MVISRFFRHSGQYTHFFSSETFSRKTSWKKSLFYGAFRICSTKKRFENQVNTLKSFMSWNGCPNSIKNYLINKLEYNDKSVLTQNPPNDENLPKVGIGVPYLGKRGENLVNSCLKKIRRCLTHPVKFIVIYDTKKISYFISNKDKIPDFSRSNLVYQITCPGCNKSYIGKTDRCLHKRLFEYATQHNTSVVAQHLLEYEHALFIANFCHQYDRPNNLSCSSSDLTSCMKNLIFNNYKILYSKKSCYTNQLLIIEALQIKFIKPELNSSLKASKELSLST